MTWGWTVVHLAMLLWLVRIEMLLYRMQRMADDVTLVETLLRCWVLDGEWSPKVRTQLQDILRGYKDKETPT